MSDGSIECLKWIAVACMVLDHVNKHLLHGTSAVMFNAGRLAMPIFAGVLAYNMARPQSLARMDRVLTRLGLTAVAASVPFIGLGGLAAGWWPLNIMVTLLVATATLRLWLGEGARNKLAASAMFLVGGALVEFWWFGLAAVLLAWRFWKDPRFSSAFAWTLAIGACSIVNRNHWALAAMPVFYVVAHLRPHIPRAPTWVFYSTYPMHLAVIWGIQQWTTRS